MKRLIIFIALGSLVLLCGSSCDSLVEYDIRGEWDALITDNVLDQIISVTANFQGSKESGIVDFTPLVPDEFSQSNPSTYTVQGSHVIITRPGLPNAFCPTCGHFSDGAFTDANNMSGVWFDYRFPPHSGTWTMTRR